MDYLMGYWALKHEALRRNTTVNLAHIGFVYLMSECCLFLSTKFTRIYHLRGYFSKISPRGAYRQTPLDDIVTLTLFLNKNKKTCTFAHRCALRL